MKWVKGFLKIHKGQQAFDNPWKDILPYPRLSLPKKVNREVTPWPGKEMRNLGCSFSAVLASALPNTHCSRYHDFKSVLNSLSVLIDFSLMAQYRPHILDTLVYLSRYLQTFH